MKSKPDKPAILIVDDQPEVLNALERLFKPSFAVLRADNGQEALTVLEAHDVAVILTDQRMPVMTGVQMLAQSLNIRPDAVRILITAYADVHASISAVNEGQIFYYVSKPWEPDQLLLIVTQAAERHRLERENRRLLAELQSANARLNDENRVLKQNQKSSASFESMIGRSPSMSTVFKLASKILNTDTTVMITGETGTGKERLARAVHATSSRRDRIFVAQNCGALPDSLLESELFGHVKGAFTGAISDKKGLFEVAHGGTVFLDEIGDTSAAMQLRLLRVLQEGEFKPVGGQADRKVDVRVMAATHRNLEDEVAAGRFREDLYYRLNVFPIHIPPLRERGEDLPDLAHHFAAAFAQKMKKAISGINDEAMALLMAAPWPGNIRELENELERAVTLADDGETLSRVHLSPRFLRPALSTVMPDDASLKAQVEALERRLIAEALEHTGGNILKAAERLGLSRPGLHKKLDRYHLHP